MKRYGSRTSHCSERFVYRQLTKPQTLSTNRAAKPVAAGMKKAAAGAAADRDFYAFSAGRWASADDKALLQLFIAALAAGDQARLR